MLPIFPKEARMISLSLGVIERDGLVQYIANGLPIYSHDKDNLAVFRAVTCNFIE